jgi:hypothetical protein
VETFSDLTCEHNVESFPDHPSKDKKVTRNGNEKGITVRRQLNKQAITALMWKNYLIISRRGATLRASVTGKITLRICGVISCKKAVDPAC